MTIEQYFFNTSPQPLNVRYVFPLDDVSAVYSFEALLSDGIVKGICKNKETAQEEFKDAVQRGDTAFLFKREAGDVFCAELGNLRPHERCVIMLKYIYLFWLFAALCDLLADSLCFVCFS